MKITKDYSNIINKENYEGYVALWNTKISIDRKDSVRFLVQFAIVCAVVSCIVASFPSLLICFLSVFSGFLITVLLHKRIDKKNIKQVLGKYPYVDIKIPSDELVKQLSEVKKQLQEKEKNKHYSKILNDNLSSQDNKRIFCYRGTDKHKCRKLVRTRKTNTK